MAEGKRKAKWRVMLLEAQEGRCPYCVHPLVAGGVRPLTIDHVFPRSTEPWRGHVGNIVLAHKSPCNLRKHNRQPYPCEVIFLEAVNARLGWALQKKPSKTREQQRRRDRAEATITAQAAAARGPPRMGQPFRVLTARELARRPAVLQVLDEAFAGVAGSYGRLRIPPEPDS